MKSKIILTAAILFAVIIFTADVNAQTTQGAKGKGVKTNWVDANGDGICDNLGTAKQGSGNSGKGYGKKDGSGNPVRPQDGTGYGKKAGLANGTGTCANTGGSGTMMRKGRK